MIFSHSFTSVSKHASDRYSSKLIATAMIGAGFLIAMNSANLCEAMYHESSSLTGELPSAPIPLNGQDHEELAHLTSLIENLHTFKDCLAVLGRSLNFFEVQHYAGKDLNQARKLVCNAFAKLAPHRNSMKKSLLQNKINPVSGEYHAEKLRSFCDHSNQTTISIIRKWLLDFENVYNQIKSSESQSDLRFESLNQSVGVPEPDASGLQDLESTHLPANATTELSESRALQFAKAFNVPLSELSPDPHSHQSSPVPTDGEPVIAELVSNAEVRSALLLSGLNTKRPIARGMRRSHSLDVEASDALATLSRSRSLETEPQHSTDVSILETPPVLSFPNLLESRQAGPAPKRPKINPYAVSPESRTESSSRSPSPPQLEISHLSSYQFPSQAEYSAAASLDKRRKATSAKKALPKETASQKDQQKATRPKRARTGSRKPVPLKRARSQSSITQQQNLLDAVEHTSRTTSLGEDLRQLNEELISGTLNPQKLRHLLVHFNPENQAVLLNRWLEFLGYSGSNSATLKTKLHHMVMHLSQSDAGNETTLPIERRNANPHQVFAEAFRNHQISDSGS